MKNFSLTLIIFICSILLGFCGAPVRAFADNPAANIFFTIPAGVHVGDTFEVAVDADTGSVLINSVNISLGYDKSLLSFVGYKDDNTVVKLWVETPHESNGNIYMSGIIPGGVSGLYDPNRPGLSPVPLTRLLFLAKGEGKADLSFIQSQLLENDGKGTELAHAEKNGSVVISSAGSGGNPPTVTDTTPPEPFAITFQESSLFGRTPDMIVFSAQDAGSGVKSYQMQIDGGDWQDAQSPQPVSRSIFSRDIIVRAFDFHGNSQDANLTIPGLVPPKIALVIFILLVLSGILGVKLLRYKA